MKHHPDQLSPDSVASRQQTEIDFWRDAPDERPGADCLENQLDKSADALILYEALRRLDLPSAGTRRALELGGGQGWASCVLKRLAPQAHVTATDISEFAIASLPRWEKIYGVSIDSSAACTSYEIPVDEGELDFVFCFAAAHHFVLHQQTLNELARVLAPGGVAAYLYEPTAPKWLYRSAVRRVNAKRPEVPEDVLVPGEMMRLASECGLECSVDYWPATLKRSGMAAPYYALLSAAPMLCRVLPCTANFVFRKRAAG